MPAFERTRQRLLIAALVAAFGPMGPNHALAAEESNAPGEDPIAREIVRKADEIRFPRSGFQVNIRIESKNGENQQDSRTYRVLSKGSEDSVVLTMEPASERGQALLMKGRDLWVFLPSVSQPVRLSLAQRLTGQVANGDLARANFAGDYVPRILRTEDYDGEKSQVLELKAADRGVTYAKVIYWVREKDGRPQKAEFYSLSGRLLKTCRYEDYKRMAGTSRPTRLVMEDALKKGEISVLSYSEMAEKDLPDKLFTKEYLKKLQ